jgi:hypothetical protein
MKNVYKIEDELLILKGHIINNILIFPRSALHILLGWFQQRVADGSPLRQEEHTALDITGRASHVRSSRHLQYFRKYHAHLLGIFHTACFQHSTAWEIQDVLQSQYRMRKFWILKVFYGCETWSLILREEHRVKVFANKMLRRIFGPKRDEMVGGWRKLRNEEFHNLYSSPNIIRMIMSRRMRW